MHTDVDIAVIGGGLGGLTLAIGLLRRSVSVQVSEQSAEPREIGAGVAIAANATRLLRELGVEPAAAGNIPPHLEFRRWNDAGLISAHELGRRYEDRMGHRSSPCTGARCSGCSPGKCRMRTSASATSWSISSRNAVRCACAPEVPAKVVVGVDGIRSAVRRHVAGAVSPVCSGEIGFRGVIPADVSPNLPHPRSMQVWCGPGTHAITYGVDDGRLINLPAVSVPDEIPEWTCSVSRVPASRAEALAVFSGAGWADPMLDLIRTVEGDMHFRALQDLPGLSSWSRGRAGRLPARVRHLPAAAQKAHPPGAALLPDVGQADQTRRPGRAATRPRPGGHPTANRLDPRVPRRPRRPCRRMTFSPRQPPEARQR
ncbi:hypothetical protein [Amycolatopsis ultiminotia]|uniref:hypothetical protein n=1 Tax=Amycolatopsis ultiminotia TaxID=543629 RepID=UPI0031E7D384